MPTLAPGGRSFSAADGARAGRRYSPRYAFCACGVRPTAAALPDTRRVGGWVAQIKEKGLRRFLAETIADRFDLAKVEPGFIEWFLDESARTSGELLARFVPLMASVDLTAELGSVGCPTLAGVLDHDPLHSMSEYEVLRERIPDCEFVVYSGLPHNITDAAPDRCAEDLRRFLLKHRGRRDAPPHSG
jgi:pimeloyl-ACP methyl ester carboxylesterase